MDNTEASRKVLEYWYDNMWAECANELVPEITNPVYIRHDITGNNHHMKSQDYSDMVGLGTEGETVTDFSYALISENNYVGSLGRLIFATGRQWDWVQLFRVEDGHLAETWLPGMGGNDPFGVPQAWTAWEGPEIPDMLPETSNKKLIHDYYQSIWIDASVDQLADFFADNITIHDLEAANKKLFLVDYQKELSEEVTRINAKNLKLFIIEENEYLVAIGSWDITGGKQWDFAQAFRVENQKITETWIPSIGGTDDSLNLGDHSMWPEGVIPEPIYRPKP